MRNILFATNLICLTIIANVWSLNTPTPPEILEVECKKRSALISWSPTGQEPVSEYKIQYKTDWNKDRWFDYGFVQPLKDTSVRLILSPWANYTFRVSSVNSFGGSQFSIASEKVCTTEEDVPHKNPDDVYGRGNGPKNLVISWKPMPPIDHNAPGFFYNVYWKLNDEPNAHWNHRIITNWKEHRLLIENLPKLRPYRIKVEAANSLGKAPVEPVEVIGFSDEDKPSEEPQRLTVVEVIDGKTARLEWEGVEPKSLNGHFKGYKVQVWTDSYENRTEQIVAANITSAIIDILSPGKTNNIQVLAFNGAFDGPASNTVSQLMPEDIYPDPPNFLWTRVRDQNNKAVIRITYLPNVTNNNPGQKIYIQYRRKGIDTVDKWQSTVKEDLDIDESDQTSDLVNLDFEVFYEVRVVVENGKLNASSNVEMIDTHSQKWPMLTTTTSLPPPTTRPAIPPNEEREEYRNPGDRGQNLPPEDRIDPGNPEKDTEDDEGFSKTPWFIALICVLAFICVFVGIFIYLKKKRSDAHEVNRKARGTKSDQIRTTPVAANNGTTPITPNERDSFINMSADQNGSAGHDEPDEEESDRDHNQGRQVYNGTTEHVS